MENTITKHVEREKENTKQTQKWLSSYNPSREFRLCSDLETALIETPKFSSTVL